MKRLVIDYSKVQEMWATCNGHSRISVESSFRSEDSSREKKAPRVLSEEEATLVPVNDERRVRHVF